MHSGGITQTLIRPHWLRPLLQWLDALAKEGLQQVYPIHSGSHNTNQEVNQDVDLNLLGLGNLEREWSSNSLSSVQRETDLCTATQEVLAIEPCVLPIFDGVRKTNGWKGTLAPKLNT